MSLFYLCTEENCNKKYKTRPKLVDHLLECHKIIDSVIPEPVEINKTNKKIVETARNNVKRDELKEIMRQEAIKKRDIDMQAKVEAEEKMKLEQIEAYKQLEIEKLRLEQEKIRIEKEKVKTQENLLELTNKIHEKIKNNESECCMCADNPADTAIIPCGHLNFCYECIDNYHKSYPQEGCPVCRSKITNINKIYY